MPMVMYKAMKEAQFKVRINKPVSCLRCDLRSPPIC